MPITFPSTNQAARIIGVCYVLAMIMSILGYLPSQWTVAGDFMKTSQNVIDNERLFRLGIAANLVTYIIDVGLIWALYQLLSPVNQKIAMLAVLFRIIETACLAAGIIDELAVIRILTTANYLAPLNEQQTFAFARAAMGSYGQSFTIGFIFLGFGSALFCYLFLRSPYIPKWLAAWGIFASLLIAAGSLVVIAFPELKQIFPYGYAPMFILEVGAGLWLWIRGARSIS